MSNKEFFLTYLLPLIAYMILIFIISSIPQPSPHRGLDLSLLHIPEYFILAWLFYRTFSVKMKEHSLLFAVIFTVVYGILDEFHQSFVPGRVLSLLDMLYNMIGSSLLIMIS